MKYMLLIYSEPGVPEFDSDEAQQAHMGEWFAFTQRIGGEAHHVPVHPMERPVNPGSVVEDDLAPLFAQNADQALARGLQGQLARLRATRGMDT